MSDTTNPFDDWAAAWTRMMAEYPAPENWWPAAMGQGASPSEMMDRMASAHSATLESGVRYMKVWSELSTEAFALTSRAMALSAAGSDGAKELGTVTDELRAVYRKMAELPMNESRRLQTSLAEIWYVETPDSEQSGDKRRSRSVRVKS